MNQTIKCTFCAVKCTFLIVCWLDWGIQTLPYPGLGEDCLPPHIWLAFVVTPCWDFCKHPSIKSRYSARKLGKFIRQTVPFVLKLPQNQEANVFDKKTSQSQRFQLTLLGFCYDQRCPNGPPVHEIIEGHCLIQGFVQALIDCLHLPGGGSLVNFGDKIAQASGSACLVSEWLFMFCYVQSIQPKFHVPFVPFYAVIFSQPRFNSWHLFLDHTGIFGQLILGRNKNKHMEVTFVAHLSFLKTRRGSTTPSAKNPSCPRCPFHVRGSHISSLAIPKKAINANCAYEICVSATRMPPAKRENAQTPGLNAWKHENAKTRNLQKSISRQTKQFFPGGTLPLAISWVHGLAKCLWHQGLGCRKPFMENNFIDSQNSQSQVRTCHQYFANAWHGHSTPAMDCKLKGLTGLTFLDIIPSAFKNDPLHRVHPRPKTWQLPGPARAQEECRPETSNIFDKWDYVSC